jgi:PAS domain S-box-containing protein
MNLLRLIFSPPQFKNDREKTRRAQLLHIVTLVLIFLLSALVLFNILLKNKLGTFINILLIALIVLQIIVQVLTRRGNVRSAGFALMLLSWVGITWMAYSVESLRVIILFAYFTIFLGTGFLFGWRAVMLFTIWSILVVWIFAFYSVLGLFRFTNGDPITSALYLSALFVFASFQIHFVIGALRKSLMEADQELKERQHVEGVLLGERERLNLALSAAKMETWNWDIETGSVSWSAGIEAMFGMGKGQFDGKYDTYLSLIHPADLPILQQAISQALSNADFDYIVEHRLFHQNGDLHWLEGRGKVFRNADGKPVRMAGTVVDITERKRGEAERERLIRELAAKNTELEQFTYTVSHDLKAPIITIKGFLGYLQEDALGGKQERLRRDIDLISGAVDKMHLLLSELLELSRIGRMMNTPESIEFFSLVDEALDLVQGRLKNGSVKVQKMSGPLYVRGDRRRLLEVLQNLIDNAAKFMGSQSAPLIEIGQSGYKRDMPILFVRDNGIGIAPEHHERVFGLFNKLDPLAEGTGVGLALVKRIIEYHEGRIWVESEVGKGSTFFFTLPPGEHPAEIRED